jgi:heat-inducible transcriptional repressor
MITSDPTVNRRAREILQNAISTYVNSGKPVGSRRIARRSRESLSPATVRNIMADLEELGYLKQPHHSAGRVPTDKAYRLYVDDLLNRVEIKPEDQAVFDRDLQPDDNVEHTMARVSQVLSRVSQNLGIVVSPPISQIALQHIQFVRLSDRRILVVLVSRSGIVQDRVIHSEEDFSQTELDQAARYVIDHFKDKTLYEIRTLILGMIRQERARYDRFIRRVIALSARTFAEAADEIEAAIYLDGASNLIKTPEFSDINKLRVLLEAIEQKSRLALLLAQCIERDTQEVRITIGAENALPGIEDCTLITSPFALDERTHGSLGILGPTRMEYARAISLVEYAAKLLSRILARQTGKT